MFIFDEDDSIDGAASANFNWDKRFSNGTVKFRMYDFFHNTNQ